MSQVSKFVQTFFAVGLTGCCAALFCASTAFAQQVPYYPDAIRPQVHAQSNSNVADQNILSETSPSFYRQPSQPIAPPAPPKAIDMPQQPPHVRAVPEQSRAAQRPQQPPQMQAIPAERPRTAQRPQQPLQVRTTPEQSRTAQRPPEVKVITEHPLAAVGPKEAVRRANNEKIMRKDTPPRMIDPTGRSVAQDFSSPKARMQARNRKVRTHIQSSVADRSLPGRAKAKSQGIPIGQPIDVVPQESAPTDKLDPAQAYRDDLDKRARERAYRRIHRTWN